MTITNDTGPFSLTPLWVLERLVTIKETEALRLYVGLSKWTNGNDRQCHPSRATIAEYIGCSTKTTDRYVTALTSIGALQVEHRYTESGDPTSNGYRICTSLPGDTDDQTPLVTGVATPRDTDVARSRPIVEADPVEADSLVVASQATVARHPDDQPSFDTWWENYPKKQGKAAARKTWAKMTQDERIAAWDALAAWNRKAKADGKKFLPMASTWLNQQRWEDEDVEPEREASPNVRRIFSPDLQANVARVLGEDTQRELER